MTFLFCKLHCKNLIDEFWCNECVEAATCMIYNPIFVNINNVVIKTLLIPLLTAVMISAIVNLNFHGLKP